MAAEVGELIAVGRFTPSAELLLVDQQPVGPGYNGRVVGRHAGGDQSGERLPSAINVIDAKAAEPTAVGILRAAT